MPTGALPEVTPQRIVIGKATSLVGILNPSIQNYYAPWDYGNLRGTAPVGGYPNLKYFVDPDAHWDAVGYWEQLRSLESRLSKSGFDILSKTSFHDAEVLAIQVTNLGTWGRRRIKDPTEVTIQLWHPNEYVYTLKYGGITSMDFALNWRRQTYIGLDGQEHFYQEDRGGIHDWLYDEITAYDDSYLQHEIGFASGATLLMVFRRLSCSRSVMKRRYKEAPKRKGHFGRHT